MIRKLKRGLLNLLLILFGLLVWSSSSYAQSEYIVKALIIEKFAKYSRWPPQSKLNKANSPFIICIVGSNPFGDIMDRIYSVKKIKGHKVQVKYIKGNQPLQICHILFLANDSGKRIPEVVEFSQKNSILTFSDNKSWVQKGICVNLYITKKQTILFKINEQSLRNNQMQVNSLLLDYGRSTDH